MKAKDFHLMPAPLLRQKAEAAMVPNKVPSDIALEIVPGGPVKGEWHRSAGAIDERTFLYLHGGGYYFGSAKAYRRFTFGLARQGRGKVFSLDYRMAPEAPYPAALDDALVAYRWLLDSGIDPRQLIVGGDSAGGGLAFALMLKLKEKNLPLPAGLFTFSPWTDLACTGASLDENEMSDVMFRKVHLTTAAHSYCGERDPKTPFISPLYGDLTSLPPTQIFVSNDEVLLDDSLRMAANLKKAGVSVELIRESGLTHEWPTFYGRIPEAKKAMNQLVAFIEKTLHDSGSE